LLASLALPAGGCMLAPLPAQPLPLPPGYAGYGPSPVLTYQGSTPFVTYGGATFGLEFNPGTGWGWRDGGRRWHPAPQAWSAQLDAVPPAGAVWLPPAGYGEPPPVLLYDGGAPQVAYGGTAYWLEFVAGSGWGWRDHERRWHPAPRDWAAHLGGAPQPGRAGPYGAAPGGAQNGQAAFGTAYPGFRGAPEPAGRGPGVVRVQPPASEPGYPGRRAPEAARPGVQMPAVLPVQPAERPRPQILSAAQPRQAPAQALPAQGARGPEHATGPSVRHEHGGKHDQEGR